MNVCVGQCGMNEGRERSPRSVLIVGYCEGWGCCESARVSLRGMWADVIVCCWDERLDLQVDHLRCMCSVSGCVMICESDDDPLQILQAICRTSAKSKSLASISGCKIHAGTQHFAVLPLSLAVKPWDNTLHDLLPCPDCKNRSK